MIIKRFKILTFITVFVFVCHSQLVYAEKKPLKKLKRGAINVVTAPLELPWYLYLMHKDTPKGLIENRGKNLFHLVNPFYLIFQFSVVGYGLGSSMIREVSGIWDVVSFPFPAPGDYEPIYKPEYFWESGFSEFFYLNLF